MGRSRGLRVADPRRRVAVRCAPTRAQAACVRRTNVSRIDPTRTRRVDPQCKLSPGRPPPMRPPLRLYARARGQGRGRCGVRTMNACRHPRVDPGNAIPRIRSVAPTAVVRVRSARDEASSFLSTFSCPGRLRTFRPSRPNRHTHTRAASLRGAWTGCEARPRQVATGPIVRVFRTTRPRVRPPSRSRTSAVSTPRRANHHSRMTGLVARGSLDGVWCCEDARQSIRKQSHNNEPNPGLWVHASLVGA